MDKPKISFWTLDNQRRIETISSLFGNIKRGTSSSTQKILMWNNRGGAEKVESCTWNTSDTSLGTAGYLAIVNLSSTDDFIKQGWVKICFADMNDTDADIEYKLSKTSSAITQLGAYVPTFTNAQGVYATLSGDPNTGSTSDTKHYTYMCIRIDIPSDATLGYRDFSFAWQSF